MLAMTTKNNVRAGDTLPEEETATNIDSPESSGGRMPLPSGLSALIQAATAQLSLLGDEPEGSQTNPRRVVTMTQSEDTASSDGEAADVPTLTPTIVPEPDPQKQSFPELLMTLALDPSNIDVIAFLPDGKFFAIRTKEFSDNLMTHFFAVASFAEFLDSSQDWGFTRVLKDDNCSGIEVFRHPSFIKGNWNVCARIRFGESPTEARLSALPEKARIDMTLSDDSINSAAAAHSKRRLSPGFLSRRESETSTSSQKQKLEGLETNIQQTQRARSCSNADSEAAESLIAVSHTNVSRTDDLRSIALAITTEKLKIKTNSLQENLKRPLVQRAVESATHTIVTDAIETLLRDESHTKQTYLKHEKELSRSSLPGVVPLSTQLFSPGEGPDRNTKKPAAAAAAAQTSSSTAAPLSENAACPRSSAKPKARSNGSLGHLQ